MWFFSFSSATACSVTHSQTLVAKEHTHTLTPHARTRAHTRTHIYRSLNLSHNLLKKIPAALGTFTALQKLFLAGNFWEFAGLPDEMGNLKKLTVLDLEVN